MGESEGKQTHKSALTISSLDIAIDLKSRWHPSPGYCPQTGALGLMEEIQPELKDCRLQPHSSQMTVDQ